MTTLRIDPNRLQGTIHIDKDVLAWYLNSIDGPVGVFLQELAVQMASMSGRLAPVIKPWNLWNPVTSSAVSKVPDTLRTSVHAKVGYSQAGKIYGGVNAMAEPTVFLEDPASQLHMEIPFMTTALWTVPAQALV